MKDHDLTQLSRFGRRTLFVLLFSAASGAAAQGPVMQAAPADQPTHWAGEETAEETITKALGDMASDNAEDRRRAALVLGKYEHPRAMVGLARSLSDEAATVRRAALVSIAEHPQWLAKLAPLILGRLDDSDVHIRRIASSVLPQTMSGYFAVRTVRQSDGKIVRDKPPSRFEPETAATVRSAFRDADATVRKNMLTYHYYFLELLTPQLIAPLLEDPERDVRVLAVQAAARVMNDAQFVDAAQPPVQDDDRLVRLQAAKMLGRIHERQALPLLQAMTGDQDPEVAGEAVLAVVRRGRRPEHVEVETFLARQDVDIRTGLLILASLPALGAESEPLLRDYFNHARAEYRAAAFNAYGNAFAPGRDPAEFRAFLDDPSQQVRQAVLRAMTRAKPLARDDILALITSNYPDIRAYGARSSARLGRKEAAPILNDLIFDENDSVRQAAITMMARLQVPGWIKVATLSLQDDDDGIQRTAAMALAASDAQEAEQALDQFLRTTDNAQLKALLARIQLQRQAAQKRQQQTPEREDTP